VLYTVHMPAPFCTPARFLLAPCALQHACALPALFSMPALVSADQHVWLRLVSLFVTAESARGEGCFLVFLV
jgi:hypothetical protein